MQQLEERNTYTPTDIPLHPMEDFKMRIYTSKNCLNCITLKQILSKNQTQFEEIDGTTTKSVAFLRARKLPMQLPIIEDNGKFFTFEQYTELLPVLKYRVSDTPAPHGGTQ